MSPKHPESTDGLIEALHSLRVSNPKAIRSNVHIYPTEIYLDNGEGSSTGNEKDRRITSWKMTEHMYFNTDNPFPTMARGLFTEEIDEESTQELVEDSGEDKKKERIVARGYDKFFNIDEVPWTDWDVMSQITEAPYYLTLKSNGCLIMISALSESHLMVASKHSLGTITEEQVANDGDVSTSLAGLDINGGDAVDKKGKGRAKAKDQESQDITHAAVGREWLKKTLVRQGKKESELAKRLWDQNLTAVLELCDDSFEEHVIATPEYWTGLHLHGLNHNTPQFSTLPPSEITIFAEEFGFIPTKTIQLGSLNEVKSFTDDIAKSGSFEGDMIEGFVVRTSIRSDADLSSSSAPPYKPGSPFFFKIKFDEPYLMYRQFREITRVMLPLLEKDITDEKQDEIWSKVKKKIKRPEVALYADWTGRMMKEEPELFDDYNRGIIKVRDRFLRWAEGNGEWENAGSYKLKGAESKKNKKKGQKEEIDKSTLPTKYVLVPIAVPGCGKTLVGLVLTRLFGFGHTQSDDVTTKRSAPTFLKNILQLLKTHDVVYADRNNHIEKHYEELLELANSKEMKNFNLKFIAILWDIESHPYHRLLRICSERVLGRGDNHQTLRPDKTVNAEHEAVIGSFLRNYTSPDKFTHIIDTSILDTPSQTIRKIVDGLTLSLKQVTDEDIERAVQDASDYKPQTEYHPPNRLGKDVRYFGLAPEIDLVALVEIAIYHMPPDLAGSAARFLSDIQSKKRVISSPHITLCHETNVQAEVDGMHTKAWNECMRLSQETMMWEFEMTHLVWDARVMAIMVKDLVPRGKAEALRVLLHEGIKEALHITVGTKSEEIRAYESKGLISAIRERVKNEDNGEMKEIVEGGGKVRWAAIGNVKGEGRVKGMY